MVYKCVSCSSKAAGAFLLWHRDIAGLAAWAITLQAEW